MNLFDWSPYSCNIDIEHSVVCLSLHITYSRCRCIMRRACSVSIDMCFVFFNDWLSLAYERSHIRSHVRRALAMYVRYIFCRLFSSNRHLQNWLWRDAVVVLTTRNCQPLNSWAWQFECSYRFCCGVRKVYCYSLEEYRMFCISCLAFQWSTEKMLKIIFFNKNEK